MKLYCYHIAPIDFWYGAMNGEELMLSIYRNGEVGFRGKDAVIKGVQQLIHDAEKAFRTIGWEGDVRQGPYFFAVPSDTEMQLGYMLKQDNNGSCFIASPVELPEASFSIFEKTIVN